MPRTVQTRPLADAVLAADLHLREDTPRCRTDDYWAAQERKVRFIRDLCHKHSCPLFVAGDVFHRAKPSPRLLAWAIDAMPAAVMIPGQHDLPLHSLDLFDESGLGVLSRHPKFLVLRQQKSWEELVPLNIDDAPDTHLPENWRPLAMVHRLLWMLSNPPFPGAPVDGEALRFLVRHKEHDLILSGDNHIPFVANYGDRLLVNPGSMMRMTAAQADHTPRVYLWYAERNEVAPVPLPIEEGVVDREHIDAAEAVDAQLESFVARLAESGEVGLDFAENVRAWIRRNKPSPGVRRVLEEAIE